MPANDRHVVPDPDGGWDVEKEHAERVSSHHDTQADAIHRAHTIIDNAGGGEELIHSKDGQIRKKNTVGSGDDPNPPRGQRRVPTS